VEEEKAIALRTRSNKGRKGSQDNIEEKKGKKKLITPQGSRKGKMKSRRQKRQGSV